MNNQSFEQFVGWLCFFVSVSTFAASSLLILKGDFPTARLAFACEAIGMLSVVCATLIAILIPLV